MTERRTASYEAAGVDIAAGERAVELMKSRVARARRPEVVDDASGFAGLFDASAFLRYKRPLLATSTDGVGTKVDLARRPGSTTRSGTTWSAWSSTIWPCAARNRCS